MEDYVLMNFFDEINKKYKVFEFGEISSVNSIMKLKDFSPIQIPEEYFEIITERKEIEINIRDIEYIGISIWSARRCIEMNNGYYIQKYIPNSIAIGDDGKGNTLLYANGKQGFGLYIVGFGNLDVEEMKYISKSLKDLLLKGIGVDILFDN